MSNAANTLNKEQTVRRFLLIGLLIVGSVNAAPGDCYAISDPDARAFCLAKAHGDPGRCYSIQDKAKRAECLAELRK